MILSAHVASARAGAMVLGVVTVGGGGEVASEPPPAHERATIRSGVFSSDHTCDPGVAAITRLAKRARVNSLLFLRVSPGLVEL